MSAFVASVGSSLVHLQPSATVVLPGYVAPSELQGALRLGEVQTVMMFVWQAASCGG